MISSNNPFIVKKQADLLFRNVRLGQISSILNASFLLWVVTSLNTSESHLAVAIWWLVATITAILRIWIANKYLAKDDVTRLDNAALWQKRAVLGAGASGIVWGAGALLLMFGATTTMQLFTAFVMAGVVAGAGTGSGCQSPGFSLLRLAYRAHCGNRFAGRRPATYCLQCHDPAFSVDCHAQCRLFS